MSNEVNMEAEQNQPAATSNANSAVAVKKRFEVRNKIRNINFF